MQPTKDPKTTFKKFKLKIENRKFLLKQEKKENTK